MVKHDYTDWIASIFISCCGIIMDVASIKGIQLEQQIQLLSHQIRALGGTPPDANVSWDYAGDYRGRFDHSSTWSHPYAAWGRYPALCQFLSWKYDW